MEILLNRILLKIKRAREITLFYPELYGKIELCIAGSATQVFFLTDPRKTNDIDIIRNNYVLADLFKKYDMNTDIQYSADENIPYDYIDRIIPIDIKTKSIKYYTISLEDYIIMKLMAYRLKDQHDLMNAELIKQIDWELLDELASKMDDVFLNDRRRDEFLCIYNNFKERWYNENSEF